MRAVQWLLRYLYPPRCVLCQRLLTKEESDLCGECRKNLPVAEGKPKPLRFVDTWTAALYYEGAVRESLLRYKFRGRRVYCSAYGRLLAVRIMQQLPDDWDCITYVPVGKKRLRRRGYDQTCLLAEAAARELGREPQRLLDKPKDNPAQSGIRDAASRRANVSGVYRICGDVKNKRILLIDDILTTGATASECARMLKTAGAEKVYVAAFACGRPKKCR